MFKKSFSIALFFLFLSPVIINAHGDEKNKGMEKVEKVTSMQQSMQHDDEAQSDSLREAEENEAVEKDFSTIRKEVEETSVPTVIKAVSLAVFIFGLAYAYFPKKKKEKSNV